MHQSDNPIHLQPRWHGTCTSQLIDRENHMARIWWCCLFALVLLEAPTHGRDVVAQQQGVQKSEDFLFDVQPRTIAAGETAVLRWSIKGATKVVIEEASESRRALSTVGTFGGSGTLKVSPKENTTYVVTCEGSTTFTCASVSIRVQVKKR